MILREVIQRVQSLYSKGLESDDSRLYPRHIYNKLITVRSRLIAQLAKDNKKINQWNFQTLPCIELELAPIHECPCVPDNGCTILKSVHPIPRILTDLNRHLIQSVTTLDGKVRFDETTWEAVADQKGNKYTKTSSGFYLRGEHIYITHNKELNVITLTALFADPDEANKFESYCNDLEEVQDCDGAMDKEFPIDGELLDALIALTQQELGIQFSQMAEDKINSASEEVIQKGK